MGQPRIEQHQMRAEPIREFSGWIQWSSTHRMALKTKVLHTTESTRPLVLASTCVVEDCFELIRLFCNVNWVFTQWTNCCNKRHIHGSRSAQATTSWHVRLVGDLDFSLFIDFTCGSHILVNGNVDHFTRM